MEKPSFSTIDEKRKKIPRPPHQKGTGSFTAKPRRPFRGKGPLSFWVGALSLVCLGQVGCGSSNGRVTGQIKMDGHPIRGAEIVFESLADAKERFFGSSVEGGNYQVDYRMKDGLTPGRYKVLIKRYTLPGGNPLPAGEEGEVLKNEGKAILQIYTFERDISPGKNDLDFELTEGKKTSKK